MGNTLYIIAGEASGDVIGAEILKYIADDMTVYGVGGALMAQQGLQSLFEYTDIAVMGVVDVVRRYSTLKQRLRDTVAHIKQVKPNMVITIDSQGFSKRVSTALRTGHLDFSYHHIHVVAPTVWAWRRRRAAHIERYFDTVLCLYPFEPAYFPQINAHFVGHPSVDILSTIPAEKTIPNSIAVLVGSRTSEINRCAPVYAAALQRLYNQRGSKIYVPVLPAYEALLHSIFAPYDFPYDIVPQHSKNKLLKSVTVALTTSGTMTLELGILNTPMVVGYKMESLFFQIVKRLYYKKHVALPNIILGDMPIVPEYLQSHMTADALYKAICQVMDTDAPHQRQKLSALHHTVTAPYDSFGNSVYHYIKKYITDGR